MLVQVDGPGKERKKVVLLRQGVPAQKLRRRWIPCSFILMPKGSEPLGQGLAHLEAQGSRLEYPLQVDPGLEQELLQRYDAHDEYPRQSKSG